MPALPPGITEKEIIRYGKLDAGIKKLQPEHKKLNDKIKAAFTSVGNWVVANVIIKRTEAKSFDLAAYAKDHPVEKYPELYAMQLDASLIPEKDKAKYTTMVQRLSVSTVEILSDEEPEPLLIDGKPLAV